MKAIWDPKAKKSLYQIARYIQKRFGSEARKDFIKQVRETERLILTNPHLGAVDPLFEGRKLSYRSTVINRLSKMVYFIDGETIYIAAFWDTRREPKKQAEQVIMKEKN